MKPDWNQRKQKLHPGFWGQALCKASLHIYVDQDLCPKRKKPMSQNIQFVRGFESHYFFNFQRFTSYVYFLKFYKILFDQNTTEKLNVCFVSNILHRNYWRFCLIPGD